MSTPGLEDVNRPGFKGIVQLCLRACAIVAIVLLLACIGITIVVYGSSATASTEESPDVFSSPVEHYYHLYGYTTVFTSPVSPAAVARALDIPASDLITATMILGSLDSLAVLERIPGTWFPTRGEQFVLLSTGYASDLSLQTPHTIMTIRSILNESDEPDSIQLRLQLKVPSGKNCANFDFAIYSRELKRLGVPESDDIFVAQLNTNTLVMTDSAFSAPANFALDPSGDVISIHRLYDNLVVTDTINGGIVSPLLRASVRVTPNMPVDIFLTMRDGSDAQGNTAAAIDNFFWSQDSVCKTGALGDTDSDGLPDGWEQYGITVTTPSAERDLVQFVDLPAMGARVDQRDIFVEIDYMELNTLNTRISYGPDPDAIRSIVRAFTKAPITYTNSSTTGIRLHVDYGAQAELRLGANDVWGNLSQGEPIPLQEFIGTCLDDKTFNWEEFDNLKQQFLNRERALVFHYSIFAHELCKKSKDVSGKSRNVDVGDLFARGASDFIVSLGNEFWRATPLTARHQQAGTFMHELGHNLGLMHGGADHTNRKPNQLSVMNHMFQMQGLIINYDQHEYFDYSRYALPALDESHLIEAQGIYTPSGKINKMLGTYYRCFLPGDRPRRIDDASKAIDWTCDFEISENPVTATINGRDPISPTDNNGCRRRDDPRCLSMLTSYEEWSILKYTGGLLSRNYNFLADEREPQLYLIDPSVREHFQEPEDNTIPIFTSNDELKATDIFSESMEVP